MYCAISFTNQAHHFPSKRSGLEKAIFQVEEAIKKRKSDAPSHKRTLEQLQELLNDAKDDDSPPSDQLPGPSNLDDPFAPESRDMKPPMILQHSERAQGGGSSDDQLAVEDVENPLQLLARASGEHYFTHIDFPILTHQTCA